MAKHLKTNANQITSRARRADNGFSCSPDIDNTGRGILEVRNLAWEINDKYASAGDLNVQRAENGGYTDAEKTRFWFSAYQNPYHPTSSITENNSSSSTYFARPSSWSSSVTIVVPNSYAIGKTITGNDGQQYVEIRDKATGKVISLLSEHSCMSPSAKEFNPLFRTTQSLRDDAQHYEIKYKIGTDGNPVERTETEKAIKQNQADVLNRATKLPHQLGMISTITNDEVAKNNPSFTSAAKAGIETPVVPTGNFTGAISGATPSAKPASFKPTAAANDPQLQLQA